MSTLLDYAFPVSVIETPPDADLSYLKRLAIAVIAKNGTDTKSVICYSVDDVTANTGNASAAEAFKKLNSITLLMAPTLAEIDALISDDYYTIVVSEDFDEASADAWRPDFRGVIASVSSTSAGAIKATITNTQQRKKAREALANNKYKLLEANARKDTASVETFTKSRTKAANDLAKLPHRCAFLDADYNSAGAVFAFASLLSSTFWRGQQFVTGDEKYHSVLTVGEAETLYDSRVSFYLKDEQYGTRLSFFGAGGESITTPYIEEQVKVTIQSEGLKFIATENPKKTETTQIRLTNYLNNSLGEFMQYPTDYLNKADIELFDLGTRFELSGVMNINAASDLWRVRIEATQGEG